MKRLLFKILFLLFCIFFFYGNLSFTYSQPMNIQSLLNNASPGDIVEIPGGVYFEQLHFPKSGEPGKPVILRGAPNEIVVINAGQPLKANWEAVSDAPEVFSTKVSEISEETALWEAGSRLRLKRVGSLEECLRRLGSWFYDSETSTLYLRSSGTHPANQLEFWMESDTPAITIAQSYIQIENLSVTLGGHGILIEKETENVQVKNCRAFCNKRSGIHVSGSNHLISNNEVFANNQHGIQLRYEADHVTVRGNHCFLNGPRNGDYTDVPEPVDLSLYSRSAYVLIENNIADGFTKNAYRNKYGENPTNIFRHNIVRGNANPAKFAGYNNTYLVSRPGPRDGMYLRENPNADGSPWEAADPTGIQRKSNLLHPVDFSEDPHFADPAHHDFRLQADSPALGKGAHPGFAPVFYVAPVQGKVSTDGLTKSSSFPSIAAALEIAPAGSTIYLLPGTYIETVELTTGGISEKEPFRIRAYGRSRKVIITGAWKITGSIGTKLDLNVSPGATHVEIDGLHFQSTSFQAEKIDGLHIQHCVFENTSTVINESENVQLDRNTFSTGSVTLSGKEKVFFTQNLLVNTSLQAPESVLVTAFNHSTSAFSFGPDFSLPPASPLAFAGSDFGPVGAREEDRSTQMSIENLQIAGLSPHGATLLWQSPKQNTFAKVTLRALPDGPVQNISPAMEFEIMGEYFDMSFLQESFYGIERHVSLGKLSPSQQYEASVTLLDFAGNKSEPQTIQFQTPQDYASPQTYYVSPNGMDKNDGKTTENAWKTFHHAFKQLSPGDTLILLPGTYREPMRPRISGTDQYPILIRSEQPASTTLDITGISNSAIEVLNIDYVQIEGLTLKSRPYSSGTNIFVNNTKNIRIAHMIGEYPPEASFTKFKLGASGLVAVNSPGILIEDNLFIGAVINIAVAASHDATIRHNTMILGGNYGIVIVPGSSEETYHIQGNLFDRVVMDYKKGPCIWMFDPAAKLTSDYNLFHIPEDFSGGTGKLPSEETVTKTLEEWQKISQLDAHSLAAKPHFIDPENNDFRLAPDSPGKAALPDGSDIGARKK